MRVYTAAAGMRCVSYHRRLSLALQTKVHHLLAHRALPSALAARPNKRDVQVPQQGLLARGEHDHVAVGAWGCCLDVSCPYGAHCGAQAAGVLHLDRCRAGLAACEAHGEGDVLVRTPVQLQHAPAPNKYC